MPGGRFEPGPDPRRNAGGRPKKKLITDELARELRRHPHNGKATNLQLAVKHLVHIAMTYPGSEAVSAMKLILAYVEGLPTQPIEIRDAARQVAAERGLDPDRVIDLYEAIRKRRAG